jgi:hypothetical protein
MRKKIQFYERYISKLRRLVEEDQENLKENDEFNMNEGGLNDPVEEENEEDEESITDEN